MAGYIKFVKSALNGERVWRIGSNANRWHWVALLCMADSKTFPGLLADDSLRPFNDRDFCYNLRIKSNTWAKVRQDLLNSGLLLFSPARQTGRPKNTLLDQPAERDAQKTLYSTNLSFGYLYAASYLANQDVDNQFTSRYDRTRAKVLIDNLFAAEGAKRLLFIRLIEDFYILNDLHYLPPKVFHNICTTFPDHFHNTVTLSAPKIEIEIENKNDVNSGELSTKLSTPLDNLKLPPFSPPLKKETQKQTAVKSIFNNALKKAFRCMHLGLTDKDLGNISLIRAKQKKMGLSDEEMVYQIERWEEYNKEPHEAPRYLKFSGKIEAFKILHGWLDNAMTKEEWGKKRKGKK